MLIKPLATAALLLAGVLAIGCSQVQYTIDSAARSVNEPASKTDSPPAAQPVTTAPAETTTTSAAAPTSPVRVSLDGAADRPDAYGIYWDTERSVSAEPRFVLTMDPEMGDFQGIIINLYRADAEGRETGGAWAITDFGGEKLLVPDQPINLVNPGAVTIISPEGQRIESIPLNSGQIYIALFVVTGSNSSHTHKVRFAVK